MRLLVIGGCHTYGYGLRPGQSFVEQFGQRLRREGRQPQVDYYTPLDLDAVLALVNQLDLDQYDMILLQLGNYRLQHPPFYKQLWSDASHQLKKTGRLPSPRTPDDLDGLRRQAVVLPPEQSSSLGNRLKVALKLLALQSMNSLGLVGRLNEVTVRLNALLQFLAPHGRKTFLLTPFPHLDPVSQWLRRRGRKLFMEIGRKQGVRVIDSHLFIQERPQYFLPGDPSHLNALSHELIGCYLYDRYQKDAVPMAEVDAVV